MSRTAVAAPVTPDAERQIKAADERLPAPIEDRQFVVELVMAILFGVVATTLTALDSEGFEGPIAGTLVLAFALMCRAQFVVGAGFTRPLQLVFVPMLFLLPPAVVPSCVAVGLLISLLPEFRRRQRHGERALLAVNDAWFAVGPALVFIAADPGAADIGDWWVLACALGAQLLCDFAASSVRAGLGLGMRITELAAELRIIWIVDLLLAPLGFVAALAAAAEGSFAFLLVLPLAALLMLFAEERAARLDQALELSSTYRRTALLLGDVIGEDDEYTGAHSQGVVSLAVSIADELRVGERDRQLVEFGALLHDVGKITIPKAIINKTGPLDDEEWRIMRTHTIEGQRMLDRVGGSLRDVGVVVRASHERWDGGGYPDGLAGEDIPLAARIVACADAFSAMTTDRAYRKALPRESAIAELQAGAGGQFDPRVAEATIAIVERYGLPRRPGGQPAHPVPAAH